MVELGYIPEIVYSSSAIIVFAMAVSSSLRKLIVKRQNDKCANCGTEIRNRLEIHHKLPKAYGGGNNPENLIGLCGEKDGDCHDRWDQEAIQNQRLPDGTPLKIPRNIIIKK